MVGVGRAHERELKFEVDEAFALPDLGLAAEERREVVLTADYWDTDDLRLLRWGHSLRHRRASDGSEDGWTLKLAVPGGAKAGAARDELDLPGPPDAVPAELRALVVAFVRRERLAHQATLVTVRRSTVLTGESTGESTGDSGGARYEVADDLVTSRIGNEAGPTFRQVEVEVVGSPGAGSAASVGDVDAELDAIARALEAAGAGPAGSVPKLAVVLQARLGAPEIEAPALDKGSTVGELVSASLAAGLRRLALHDPFVRLGDDPEAVHQARVATRRLRSDLKTLSPLLEAAPVARWRSDLAWLGGLLGAVRDLDVLEARLAHQIADLSGAGVPDDDGGAGAALLEAVRSERAVRRAVLADVMGSTRYVGLLEELVAAVAAVPLHAGVDGDDRAAPVATRLTRRAWRRLRRAVPGRRTEPSDAELHELRKRAKQARYAAELADGVLRGELAELADRLGDLQDVLGDLQDAVSAAAWLSETDRRVDGDTAFLAGRLHERQLQAREAARDAWPDAWLRARRRSLRRVL